MQRRASYWALLISLISKECIVETEGGWHPFKSSWRVPWSFLAVQRLVYLKAEDHCIPGSLNRVDWSICWHKSMLITLRGQKGGPQNIYSTFIIHGVPWAAAYNISICLSEVENWQKPLIYEMNFGESGKNNHKKFSYCLWNLSPCLFYRHSQER